jgi:hypothetical protein
MSLIRKVKAAEGGARQDSSTNKPCRDETLGKPGGLHIRAYSTRRPRCPGAYSEITLPRGFSIPSADDANIFRLGCGYAALRTILLEPCSVSRNTFAHGEGDAGRCESFEARVSADDRGTTWSMWKAAS